MISLQRKSCSEREVEGEEGGSKKSTKQNAPKQRLQCACLQACILDCRDQKTH